MNSNTNISPITSMLNATLASIHELTPIEIGKPKLITNPVTQTDFGVLVGVLGEIKGRLFILGSEGFFSQAGLAIYSMQLSGDMLESFVGEYGNLVGGHTATRLYEQGVKIDITPPTTMQGNVKFGGFSKALQVDCKIGEEQAQVVLALEDVQ